MPQRENSQISRAPFWLAAAGSAIWLLFLVWLVGRGAPPPLDPAAPGALLADTAALGAMLGRWAAPALAPVAALFAIAAAIAAAGRPAGAWPPVPAEDALDGAEADLTGTIARVTTLRQMLADDLISLNGMATQLRAEGQALVSMSAAFRQEAQAAETAGGRLGADIARLTNEAAQMVSGLGSAGDAIGARADGLRTMVGAMGEAFHAAAAHGDESAAAVNAALATLSESLGVARQETTALVADLQNHAGRSFENNAQAMAAIEQAVAAQVATIAAGLAEARATLDRIGSESEQVMHGRLQQLADDAAALEARLQEQIQATDQLSHAAERSFKLLDSRLDLSMRTSGEALDRLGQRLAAVNAETDRVAQPLRDGKAAAGELEAAVAALRESVMQTIDVMGTTLPARTVEASRAAETLTTELTALATAIDAAHDRAAALSEPIAESRAVVDAATHAFLTQRQSMETAGQALVVELEQARQLIAEVEDQTRDSSLAAATRLVDAMTRVREVANQAAGTMRETLDGVIAEARGSLAVAADEAMKQSFAEPIAEQARQAGAAAAAASDSARTASERAAASLLALATTMKQVEERSARAQDSLEELVRRDLNASAQLLTDRMASSSVSLASLMGKPMSDADLVAWRRGERSMFGKRAVALLDKADRRALRSMMAEDPAFAETARRHVAEFEALVLRVGGQSALAEALGHSDSGRIAMILAEAMED